MPIAGIFRYYYSRFFGLSSLISNICFPLFEFSSLFSAFDRVKAYNFFVESFFCRLFSQVGCFLHCLLHYFQHIFLYCFPPVYINRGSALLLLNKPYFTTLFLVLPVFFRSTSFFPLNSLAFRCFLCSQSALVACCLFCNLFYFVIIKICFVKLFVHQQIISVPWAIENIKCAFFDASGYFS